VVQQFQPHISYEKGRRIDEKLVFVSGDVEIAERMHECGNELGRVNRVEIDEKHYWDVYEEIHKIGQIPFSTEDAG